MHRHEALAGGDEVEQRLLLRRLDAVDVGVDEQGVVLRQGGGVEVRRLVGVGQIDAPRLEDGSEEAKTIDRFVVAVVAQEEDAKPRRRGGDEGQATKQGDSA